MQKDECELIRFGYSSPSPTSFDTDHAQPYNESSLGESALGIDVASVPFVP